MTGSFFHMKLWKLCHLGWKVNIWKEDEKDEDKRVVSHNAQAQAAPSRSHLRHGWVGVRGWNDSGRSLTSPSYFLSLFLLLFSRTHAKQKRNCSRLRYFIDFNHVAIFKGQTFTLKTDVTKVAVEFAAKFSPEWHTTWNFAFISIKTLISNELFIKRVHFA